MTAVALRGLLTRKLRTVLTMIAIVLGVSMISGTYVLTDTINAAFLNIFTHGRSADRRRRGGEVDRFVQLQLHLRRSRRACCRTVQTTPGVAQAEGASGRSSTDVRSLRQVDRLDRRCSHLALQRVVRTLPTDLHRARTLATRQ